MGNHRYQFSETTEADIIELASNLRDADRRELIAAHGVRGSDAYAIVRQSVRASTHCVSVFRNGVLLCVGGAAPASLIGQIGTPWLLGTAALDKNSALFMRHGRQCVEALFDAYRTLENHVDARNHLSIRWLRRMGFTIHDAKPYGSDGLPFHRFTLERHLPE